MGSAVSSMDRIGENELLRKFCGLEPISDNDPFWNQLLSFKVKVPLNINDSKTIEESLGDQLEALVHNTVTTGNFSAFVKVFLRRTTELKASTQCDDKIFLWQTANALTILRFCCKYFIAKLGEEDFSRLFTRSVVSPEGFVAVESESQEETFDSPLEELLNALVEIIVDVPMEGFSEATHMETLNCLIVLFSSQFFFDQPLKDSKALRYMMSGKCSIHSCLLTKTLLTNFFRYHLLTDAAYDGGGSLILGLAASMMNVLSMSGPSKKDTQPTVGNQSLLLLLILSCQHSNAGCHNPYREALFSFSNSQEKASLTSPTKAVATFKLDYSKLYDVVAKTASEECCSLLLYLLLHQNQGFKNYILSRVNMDELVLPVLRSLYSDYPISGVHHIYLSLIIMLILSEDDFFCKVIHETMIKQVDWYGDKSLPEVSLGGLVILVLLKRIQFNIVRMRDRYLHTNCFAALANMSAHFKNLHPYVTQRIISLLETMTKRHTRAVEHIRLTAQYDLNSPQDQSNLDSMQEVSVLEEGIRMLLEVINSCLLNNLRFNPHLIYTLLYKRELFESYKNHSSFQDLIQNIDMVLNHFSARVKALDKAASVPDVLDTIEKGALQWPTDRLKKFPVLKFKYVEDSNTDEFFVPYVWTLILLRSGLYWEPSKVRLFNASALIAAQTGEKQV